MKYNILKPKISAKIVIAHIAMGNQQNTMNKISKKLGLKEQEPKSRILGDYQYIVSLTEKQYEEMWNMLTEAYRSNIISGASRKIILEGN